MPKNKKKSPASNKNMYIPNFKQIGTFLPFLVPKGLQLFWVSKWAMGKWFLKMKEYIPTVEFFFEKTTSRVFQKSIFHNLFLILNKSTFTLLWL